MSGKKFDNNKPPVSLIPYEFISGLARVLRFGAEKYDRYNWAEGMDWHRIIDGMYRHLGQFESGQDVDEETNECHILHLACGAMFLYMYWLLELGKDTRWKRNENNSSKSGATNDINKDHSKLNSTKTGDIPLVFEDRSDDTGSLDCEYQDSSYPINCKKCEEPINHHGEDKSCLAPKERYVHR